ncbi:MAG: NRDE family protein, partial [Gemmatimonadetes bacterium]|nr:NRDE family protein [Gemmatimonadota bacterium]
AQPGIHGVSNALLNTPWPKVVRGKEELERLVSGPGAPDPASLIEILLEAGADPREPLHTGAVPLEIAEMLVASCAPCARLLQKYAETGPRAVSGPGSSAPPAAPPPPAPSGERRR